MVLGGWGDFSLIDNSGIEGITATSCWTYITGGKSGSFHSECGVVWSSGRWSFSFALTHPHHLDQHLSNFGAWKNRANEIVWSVNDFDEGLIYDFNLDIWRLAVSVFSHALVRTVIVSLSLLPASLLCRFAVFFNIPST